MAAAAGTLDGIIDTVSAKHDFNTYASLLGVDGKFVVVGIPPEPFSVPNGTLIFKRLTLGGSLIGGIKETQEMLDFCGAQSPPLVCDIETIAIDYVNEAMGRLEKSDVRYRFVIDVQGTLAL
jgi:cinnamyl-alcohol dehydrogenase